MDPYSLSAADWLLAAPLLWLAAAALLVLVLDSVRPTPRLEAGVALGGMLGAALSMTPLLGREETAGFLVAGGGSMLRATPALAALAIFCVGAAAFAGFTALRGLCRHEGGRHGTAFWALVLLCPMGMILTLWADHMAALFLGIEILSLPLYVLAALRRADAGSVEAGIKYFLLGAFASGFLAFGMALVYAGTGDLGSGAVATAAESGGIGLVGAGLMLIALLFKVAAAPFHLWVADVYQGSPTPVTALMAAGTKAAAIAALMRWGPGPEMVPASGWALLGSLTLLVGNFSALNQGNLKRMLALSGVAHVGILFYAFAARAAGAEAEAWSTVTYYLVAYGLAALAAFGALELAERRSGGTSDEELLRGLARRQPLVGGVLCVALLSLAGVPFTAGFLAKYFVFVEMVRAGLTVWALIGVLLTLVSFAYYLRALVTLFMLEPAREKPTAVLQDALAAAALLVPTALSIVFGLWPEPLHAL
ncbi:MAG TPA: NADH-quinone oxidoreductase subunit N [Planctomycetota bacterium]